jgi:hypothetical protein
MGASYIGNIPLAAGYTLAIQTAPNQGNLVLGTNGTYTYNAPSGYAGTASFLYKITSPQGIVQIATMNLTILPTAIGSGSFAIGAEAAVSNIVIGNNVTDQTERRERPTVSSLSNGGYILSWTNNYVVYYQLYDASGNALGAPVRPSAYSSGGIASTGLSNGGFALTWLDYQQAYARQMFCFYDANGNATSSIITQSTWHSNGGAVVELANGNIALLDSFAAGSDYDIYMSVYTPTGTAIVVDTKINTTTAGSQTLPKIAKLANGNLVTVWRDESANDGSGYGIYMRIVSPTAAAVTSEVRVNTTTSGNQDLPSLAVLAGGGFVVTWTSPQDGSGYGVYAQRYDINGTKVGSETLVNTITAGDQLDNSVTALADGGYFVTWQSNGQDGSGWGLYGQRFDSGGNSLGGAIQINNTTNSDQDEPSVTELNNGDLIVTWRSWQTGTAQIMQERLVTPTGTGAYNTLNGSSSDEILVGGADNDTISGGDGDDILKGGAGNDTLSGGNGNDTYQFGLGDGQDTINNQDSVGTDKVSFDAGINDYNIWFQQSNYDLKVQVLGTSDSITLQNWFVNDAQKVDQFTLANGETLDKAVVDQLIQAMAGFSPQALGSVSAIGDLPQSVQNTIVASWHS